MVGTAGVSCKIVIMLCPQWSVDVIDPTRSFVRKQGLRQGRIISPTGYKLHINPLLNLLQKTGIGVHIGNVNCGAPSVADDLLFLMRLIIDLLVVMLFVQAYFAGLERYIISDIETKVFITISPLW